MKKIIEVKRGEPVPSNARWLKDISKPISSKQEYCEDGQSSWYETVPIYGTFDVFEVEIKEENKPEVIRYCEDCGGKDYGHFAEHHSHCPRNPF